MSKRARLTREQEETRLHGLRMLARMIVRAHLASLREEADGKDVTMQKGIISMNGRGRSPSMAEGLLQREEGDGQ